MSGQIEVIVLHCDRRFELKRIKNSYKMLGAEVQGYIEALPHRKANYAAYCNEEAVLKRLPRNPWSDCLRQLGFALAPIGVLGNVVLCQANKKGEDCDVGESIKLAVRTYHREHFERAPEAREAAPDVPDCAVASSSNGVDEDEEDSESEYDGDDDSSESSSSSSTA
jgi:hypothetical protein